MVDQRLVGFLRGVVQERGEGSRVGRQAGQVERHAPRDRPLVGFWCRLETFGFELLKDESVEWIPRPAIVADRRRCRS